MGSPIAERIIKSGIRVISPLSGRSNNTIERARKYGIEDSGTLKDSIQDSDLIISILVPDAAENLSKEISIISKELNKEIYFADLNAISPETVLRMNDILSNGKVKFIDGGIIGTPPKEQNLPRIYVSGENSNYMTNLDGLGMKVIDMGGKIGAASAMKMAYASITKGYSSLLIAASVGTEEPFGNNNFFSLGPRTTQQNKPSYFLDENKFPFGSSPICSGVISL